MLTLEGLSAAYGAVTALDRVDMTVERGSITAVLGANGAGKTTLLRTVCGLVRAAAGRVVFDGRDITTTPTEQIVQLGLAQVPEGRGVVTELTIDENLRLGGLWRKDKADKAKALTEMYELFPPLAQRRKRAASTLSGGERQMLVIGRALMARPTLLLLDEPSLGLAPLITRQIMTLLQTLRDSSDLTVLLVEQNAQSALSVADRGVVLNVGQVVVTDSASALAADDGLRHAYLGF